MRLLVVGVGRVGNAVLEASSWQDDVTVIERDPERVKRAGSRFEGARILEGDATDEETLRRAGVPDVDALISTTPHDPTNLMVCSLAKRLGVPNVITRVSGDNVVPLFAEVGAVPVPNPNHLTAEHLYHAFQVPDVRTFMSVGEDAEVVTIALSGRSRMAGRRVRDAHFPREALLIAINRKGRLLVPTADFTLEPGDILTLVARTHRLEHLVGRILGKPARRFTERLRALFER